MSGSIPRDQRAQVLFKTALDAAQKSNFDYAIQMGQEACKLVPDDLKFRRTLREIERRKFGGNPAKVGRFVGTKNGPIRTRAKMARAKSQWSHVLEVCEEAFVNNPWDVEATEIAAEAAEQLGLKELAEWLMESGAATATNAAFFRHLAHTHELNEHWQKAISAWERVKKLDPNNEEAGRQINALSANATIARSGLGEAISKKPEGNSGPEAAVQTPEDLKIMAMSPEDRLRKEIQDHPTRIGPYLELADIYKGQDRLDEAEQTLAQALKQNLGDTYVQQAHAEIQMARLSKHIDAWTRRSQADPTDKAAQAKVDQLKAMRADYEIKEIRRRISLQPENMTLHLKLGECLARAGQHDAAIGEFQLTARSSPELKVKALYNAGLAFEASGVLKLSERSYLEALKALEASEPDDLEMANDLHYHLGRVAEAQGNLKSAEDHYNEVAANDYGYKDVAQRLRNLNQGPSA